MHRASILGVLACAFVLLGCDVLQQQIPHGTPIARASDGAAATVVLISCPRTLAGGMLVQEVINAAMQNGELAIASRGGSARVIIDACPDRPEMPATPAQGRRR